MAKTMFDYINSSTELIEENLKKRIAQKPWLMNISKDHIIILL